MLSGSGLLPGDLLDHCSDFALAKAIESECGDIGSSDPGRLELRAVCNDEQHRKCSQSVDGATEHFKARRVGPMRVLKDHEDRIGPRERFELRG